MEGNNISFGKRPKNPLRKRVLRDLRREWKRYLMIFAMLVVTIGFVSGMYVANNSMMTSLDKNAEKFSRESGHFELSWLPSKKKPMPKPRTKSPGQWRRSWRKTSASR